MRRACVRVPILKRCYFLFHYLKDSNSLDCMQEKVQHPYTSFRAITVIVEKNNSKYCSILSS